MQIFIGPQITKNNSRQRITWAKKLNSRETKILHDRQKFIMKPKFEIRMNCIKTTIFSLSCSTTHRNLQPHHFDSQAVRTPARIQPSVERPHAVRDDLQSQRRGGELRARGGSFDGDRRKSGKMVTFFVRND